jgi:hypothetical protein
MKTALVALLMTMASFVWALPPRSISVTVDGVTYQCTNSGIPVDDCPQKVEFFNRQMDRCAQTNSVITCIDQLWPQFKRNNLQCMEKGGYDSCMDYCQRSLSYNACTARCAY